MRRGHIRGGSLATRAYQFAANQYRKRFCNGRARPLYDGELHPGCQNFTGPGTRLSLPDVYNYPPYDAIDACSRQHDIDYGLAKAEPDAQKRALLIRAADERAIACYNQHPELQPIQTLAKLGISGKLNLEKLYSYLRGKPSVIYGGCCR